MELAPVAELCCMQNGQCVWRCLLETESAEDPRHIQNIRVTAALKFKVHENIYFSKKQNKKTRKQ